MNKGIAHKNIVFGIAAACVAAVGIILGYRSFVVGKTMPPGLLLANGRIEGDVIVVSTKVPGRIDTLHAAEGDSVTRDQVLADLDDRQIKARTEQARATLASAEAGLTASRAALKLLISENAIRIKKSHAAVASARAVLAKARANETQSRKDAERLRSLAEEDSVGRQKAERAALAYEAAKNDRLSAEAGLEVALRQQDDAQLADQRVEARQAETHAIEAKVDQARAGVREAESVLNDLTVKAPTRGVVTSKITNPGEVVAAGSPLFTLVDMDRLYLKVYVPEISMGRLKLGQKAKIYLDAMPERPFDGTVKTIASQAEFTPKEVQTPDERVKLVYAVKIYLDENPGHAVTPGIPSDAVIRWDENVAWVEPRW